MVYNMSRLTIKVCKGWGRYPPYPLLPPNNKVARFFGRDAPLKISLNGIYFCKKIPPPPTTTTTTKWVTNPEECTLLHVYPDILTFNTCPTPSDCYYILRTGILNYKLYLKFTKYGVVVRINNTPILQT